MRLIDADKLVDEEVIALSRGAKITNACIWEDIDNAPTANAVVLPCKVGDIVYTVLDNEIVHLKIEDIIPFGNTNYGKVFNCYAINELDYYEFKDITFAFSDIGKTVFLTREEAEAKLKEMEANNG